MPDNISGGTKFVVIYGTKGKIRTIGTGSFYCPRCKTNRSYKHQKISKYFSLYFIPIFPIQNLGEYIECQFCFTPFETSILEINSQESQSEINQFIENLKSKLDEGFPLELLYAFILNDGGSEEVAKTVIAIVSEGKIKNCDRCDLSYIYSLNYCHECGNPLSEIK